LVVLRRLTLLGLVEKEHYRRLQADIEARFARTPKGAPRAPHPSKKCVLDNGVAFTAMVMHGYHEERLNGADVADYLGVRLKHMNAVEVELQDRASAA
jgi:hypothetical protein